MSKYLDLINKTMDESDKIVDRIVAGELTTVDGCEEELRRVNGEAYKTLEGEYAKVPRDSPEYCVVELEGKICNRPNADVLLRCHVEGCRRILRYLEGDERGLEDWVKEYIEDKLGQTRDLRLNEAYKTAKQKGRVEDYTGLIKKRYKNVDCVIKKIVAGELTTVEGCEEELRKANGETYEILENEEIIMAKEEPFYQFSLPKKRQRKYDLPKVDTFLECDVAVCKDVLTYLNGNRDSLDKYGIRLTEMILKGLTEESKPVEQVEK